MKRGISDARRRSINVEIYTTKTCGSRTKKRAKRKTVKMVKRTNVGKGEYEVEDEDDNEEDDD